MCFTCCDCGQNIKRRGLVGRPPKRCRDCRNTAEKSRLKRRDRPGKNEGRHLHECSHCAQAFRSVRTSQKYCSPLCRQMASRVRVRLRCANAACGNTFESHPAAIANGRRFCCRKCSYPPPLICQNPKCGREFRMKHVTKNPWQNKGKYCCPECYRDHRWGEHRPKRRRSKTARRRAADVFLAGSLRKRCKVFGVTFDPACTRAAVLGRDRWRCQKCGVLCNNEYKLDPVTKSPDWRNAEHDHIIPLSVAGSPGNVFENSQCLCRRCNGKKRDKPEGQLRLCLEEEAWGVGVRVRSPRNSKSSVATRATVL